MNTPDKADGLLPKGSASDHLANERTFLAWVRTGVGIMAFGFVVVKFSLFIKQLSLILDGKAEFRPSGNSSLAGIVLVATGLLTIIFTFLRYRVSERQLHLGNYRPSGTLIWIITFFIFGMGLILLFYLVQST